MYISGLTIIKIILLCLTIISTYWNIEVAFFSGKTETVSTTRNLSETEFPVIFKLSVTGLLKTAEIEKTHHSVASYFIGIEGGAAGITKPQFSWTDRNGNKTVQEDAGEVGVRPVLENLERHSGDKLEAMLAGSVYTYNMKFSQEIYDDLKTRETCQHYPSKHFKTYQECDKSYVRKVLDDEGLVNIIPIWATDKIEEVTTVRKTEQKYLEIGKNVMYPLAAGLSSSKTCAPCRKVFTNTKLVSRSNVEGLKMVIYPDPLVTITTVQNIKFNFFTVLSFLGSNMGLFLGLGALQFIELFYNKLCNIKLFD